MTPVCFAAQHECLAGAKSVFCDLITSSVFLHSFTLRAAVRETLKHLVVQTIRTKIDCFLPQRHQFRGKKNVRFCKMMVQT